VAREADVPPNSYDLAPAALGGFVIYTSSSGAFVEVAMTGEQQSGKRNGTKDRVKTQKAVRFNDVQFIQYELDKAQQAECKASAITADELFDQILACISDGYKFSVRWDSYGECYGAYMQADSPENPNAGFILTGRGSSPLKAVKQVLYKHRVCLDGSWGEYAERKGRDVIDD